MDDIEIIKDKLVWVTHEEDFNFKHIQRSADTMVFMNDKSLIYTAFFADFGPFDLGLMYKFCQQLHDTMLKAKEAHKVVMYHTTNNPHVRSNSAVLLCAYMILVLNATVEQAYGPFIGMDPQFIPFRDAGFCINTFPINVLDCARAMKRAKDLGHYSYRTFSLSTFQNLAKLQNGDISWIIPGKFIAFSGPITKRRQVGPGVYTLTPEEYVPVMKGLGVTCIVRFNSKCYDRNVFLSNGIRHVDLFYEDGGNPTEAILQAFLQICEQERGAIAVHCKAGLGRTGTNIAAYMMKHYGYTAKETIAWCRLCRPGSVVGPQQQYLATIEQRMFKEGAMYRERHGVRPPPLVAERPQNGETRQRTESGSSGIRSLHTPDLARSQTPPIFNNPRDNSNAANKQPVESLFQKSASKTRTSVTSQFYSATTSSSSYSKSGSPLTGSSRNGMGYIDTAETAATTSSYTATTTTSTTRPLTASAGVASRHHQEYSRSTGNGVGSSNSPLLQSRQNLHSASPSTAASRLQQAQSAQGGPITPVKNGYFSGASSAGLSPSSAFQTPPSGKQAAFSPNGEAQQQQSAYGFSPIGTENGNSPIRGAGTDGKLIMALNPTVSSHVRPSSSFPYRGGGGGGGPSSSPSDANTSPPTLSALSSLKRAGSGGAAPKRAVSVNRSVHFSTAGTGAAGSRDNNGDLDYRYAQKHQLQQQQQQGLSRGSGGGGRLSASVDYERQPRPSPSLQYQQQQQLSGSPNSTASQMRLASANAATRGSVLGSHQSHQSQQQSSYGSYGARPRTGVSMRL